MSCPPTFTFYNVEATLKKSSFLCSDRVSILELTGNFFFQFLILFVLFFFKDFSTFLTKKKGVWGDLRQPDWP